MPRITGTLIEPEYRDGTIPANQTDDGKPYNWANCMLHILDGRTVEKVKVKNDDLPKIAHFQPGDLLDLRVTVSAVAGARSAYTATTFVSEWAASSTPALVAVND